MRFDLLPNIPNLERCVKASEPTQRNILLIDGFQFFYTALSEDHFNDLDDVFPAVSKQIQHLIDVGLTEIIFFIDGLEKWLLNEKRNDKFHKSKQKFQKFLKVANALNLFERKISFRSFLEGSAKQFSQNGRDGLEKCKVVDNKLHNAVKKELEKQKFHSQLSNWFIEIARELEKVFPENVKIHVCANEADNVLAWEAGKDEIRENLFGIYTGDTG